MMKNAKLIVRTQKEVATFFEKDVRTIKYWVRDGMPVEGKYKYDLQKINEWHLARNSTNEKDYWATEFRKMKAKLAELELKQKKGELLSREEVEAKSIEQILSIKQKFLALPGRIAPQLVGLEAREIEVLLLDRITERIHEYAEAKGHGDVVLKGARGLASPREADRF